MVGMVRDMSSFNKVLKDSVFTLGYVENLMKSRALTLFVQHNVWPKLKASCATIPKINYIFLILIFNFEPINIIIFKRIKN